MPAAHRDGGGDALRVDVQVSVLVPDLLEDGQDAGEGVVGIPLGTRRSVDSGRRDGQARREHPLRGVMAPLMAETTVPVPEPMP